MELTDNERNDIATLAAEAAYAYRDLLGSRLGQQSYGADRDYYRILGYKRSLTLNDYYTRYQRGDIAARVVDLPAQDTWRRPPQITVNGSDEHPFVQAWEELAQRLKVWSVFTRLDRLTGLGRYGVLLLGVRGGSLATPLKERTGPEDLRYLRPFAELHAEIAELDNDPSSARFGWPTQYKLTLSDENDPSAEEIVIVHWSRVIHVADNKLDSDVYGIPRLKKVWNRLDDLMKLTGGSAEATWLNMRRGTVFKTQEGYRLSGTDAEIENRQEMIKQYVHDVARILVLEGLEVSDLGGSTVDPRGAYDVTLAQLSAATGIPQRVLVGSAQGELAAAEQDTKIWYDQVASRQLTWAEPDVLRPFIDRLIEYGMLPGVPEYDIGEVDDHGERRWPSLWQVSEVERAAISMNRGQAVAAVRNPVTGQVPLTESELREVLGVPGDVPQGEEVEETPMPVRPAEGAGQGGRPRTPQAGPEPSANLQTAMDNYADGRISAKQLAQYAAMEWSRIGGDG